VTAVNIHKLAISGSGRSPSLYPQLRTALERRWSGAETGWPQATGCLAAGADDAHQGGLGEGGVPDG